MPVETECQACGTLITAPPSRKRKFCSKECRGRHARPITHGESRSRLYSIWCGMKRRCKGTSSAHANSYYAARGIRVCGEWEESYESFRKWALDSGYEQGLEIDRIENSEGYCPSNCRWATRGQQMRNTRVRSQGNKTSVYRGVQRLHNSTGPRPWRASIFLRGKSYHIGVFGSEMEAAKAYDEFAEKEFKEFASLNFKNKEVFHLSSDAKNQGIDNPR